MVIEETITEKDSKVAEKKKVDVKTENAAKIARTQARKAANVAKNQARYEANLAKVNELGLAPRSRDKTTTKMIKKGKKVEFKTFTREKKLSPAELLRNHAREEREQEQRDYNLGIKSRIDALEAKIDN